MEILKNTVFLCSVECLFQVKKDCYQVLPTYKGLADERLQADQMVRRGASSPESTLVGGKTSACFQVPGEPVIHQSLHELAEATGKSYRTVVQRVFQILLGFWDRHNVCLLPRCWESSGVPNFIIDF